MEARNLTKIFNVSRGMLHAVDGVDFKIYPGQTLGVVGESGCGKSTLGNTILRLTEPTSGEMYFEGKEYSKVGKREMREMRKDMQMIFQDPYSSIDPRMCVADIIAEYMIINRTYKTKREIYAQVEKLMDTVGLAKRLEEIYLPGREDPIRLDEHSEALRLIQRVRDEAHRFAITHHRGLRTKRSVASRLEEIPGIGATRRRALLTHFPNVDAIREATMEELLDVPGMNRPAAEAVYAFFHAK